MRPPQPASDYFIETEGDQRVLVVAGPWTSATARILRSGEVDGLVLNYARGFCEPNLDFIEGWPIRTLELLDRTQKDLTPVYRIAGTVEDLQIQAAPTARLNLTEFQRIKSIGGAWKTFDGSVSKSDTLQEIVTWQFYEEDARSLAGLIRLRRLWIKDAPRLLSLSGVENLRGLIALQVDLARNLSDIREVAPIDGTLLRLGFTQCPSIVDIGVVASLENLEYLEFGDCGEVLSLAAVATLSQLEAFYAWGTTRPQDCDLTPLLSLKSMRDLRMKSRRCYKPSLDEVKRRLGLT